MSTTVTQAANPSGNVVTTTTDPVTGGVSISSGNVGSHVAACAIGDSITGRGRLTSGLLNAASGIGWCNWANWLIGAPFVFTQNLSVPGDVTRSVLSRISAISPQTKVVFLMTGTNDVLGMSSSANQATIDGVYTAVSGYLTQGVAALVAAGKLVVLSTIIPNSGLSTSTDSRIQLLDRLNAHIASLASESVFIVDAFSALWDSAQPTLRVCKANTMSDATHPAGTGAYLIGKAGMVAGKAVVAKCAPSYDLYADFTLCRQLYSAFRSGTGGDAAVKTAGTGNLADGWRSINNAGSATFTLENADAYVAGSNYVGALADTPVGIDEHWQQINVTSAIANDNPRIMLPSTSTINNGSSFPDNILGGDLFFMEVDVFVESPVNLKSIVPSLYAYFTAGTTPGDQPYAGSSYQAVRAASMTDSASTEFPFPEGFRAFLRTPILRVPENINVTVQHTLSIFIDMVFSGNGSALVKIGRPRIWHRSTGLTQG